MARNSSVFGGTRRGKSERMARKPVRSPFVVTVAVLAGAALPACGGQVRTDPSATTDAGGDTEPQSDTEVTPDTTPPIETTCPKDRPTIGSACRASADLWCEYGTCAAGSYPVTLKCEGGTWQQRGGSSCNPPPVCPAVPYEGAPCTPGFGDCSYPDKCEARPPDAPAYVHWACLGDRLGSRETTTDYVVKCPAVAPKNGDPCNCAGHYPGPCSYGDCYGTPTIRASCDERTMTWSVGETSCNPPPPDAG
jgi:hypothetical protein